MKHKIITLLFLAVITRITVYAQAVNKQDSLALVDLYNSTNGPGWTNNGNWLTDQVFRWYGVKVIGTRVTEIRLNINKLKGSIPTSIGNLTNLTLLWLTENKLSGSIPSSVGNLVKLTRFWLNKNQLSGNIPLSIGNLANLKDLDLSENKLSGSIAASIGTLVKLTSLRLDDNQLSGSIPSSIGNLAKLGFLSLGSNKLNGSIPSSLGNLLNLGYLWVSNNQLTGNIPSSLGNTSLYWIDLSSNQLSGSIPTSLGNNANVGFLQLDNNQLSGSIPSSLGNLTNLQELDLSHNKLNGDIPSSFANLQSLVALDLSYNHFTFNSMQFIQKTFPFAQYSNQALIPVHQHGNTLTVSAGGTLKNNTYKWFKVGQAGNSSIKGDSVFHPSESGKYFVKVFNSVATQLILKSDTIKYTAPATSDAPPIAFSEDALQQQDKANPFLIYPNPAKDILHIQTNGKAVVSLTDQSGKIILAKTIQGSGVISVAALPADLYYLKNNATGETQKVIIAK